MKCLLFIGFCLLVVSCSQAAQSPLLTSFTNLALADKKAVQIVLKNKDFIIAQGNPTLVTALKTTRANLLAFVSQVSYSSDAIQAELSKASRKQLIAAMNELTVLSDTLTASLSVSFAEGSPLNVQDALNRFIASVEPIVEAIQTILVQSGGTACRSLNDAIVQLKGNFLAIQASG
ncbi:uncharacterized protein LOC129748591 [Uranotaenia lowii]|uniref:uncharacterized protein LOC129748591 n=1 Tax=Uranotaenia lowii TaxID=190385 RepID=UPI002478BE46|nr:uncharacterized protein LOC129748591 [Uranotaenia lowii]